MLQSETNYDQGDNTQQTPPAPWTANSEQWGDPDFSWCGGSDKRCRMGYANFINGGTNIYTYGSASWAFFSGPGYQGCGQYQCQGEFSPLLLFPILYPTTILPLSPPPLFPALLGHLPTSLLYCTSPLLPHCPFAPFSLKIQMSCTGSRRLHQTFKLLGCAPRIPMQRCAWGMVLRS